MLGTLLLLQHVSVAAKWRGSSYLKRVSKRDPRIAQQQANDISHLRRFRLSVRRIPNLYPLDRPNAIQVQGRIVLSDGFGRHVRNSKAVPRLTLLY